MHYNSRTTPPLLAGGKFYTFNAWISRPIAMTNHSPGPVEWPVFNVIEFMYGDHAIFDISPPLV